MGDQPIEREDWQCNKEKSAELTAHFTDGGSDLDPAPDYEAAVPELEEKEDVIYMEGSLVEPTLVKFGSYVRDLGVWEVKKEDLKEKEFKTLLKYKSCYASLEDVCNNKYMSFDDKRELVGEERRYKHR